VVIDAGGVMVVFAGGAVVGDAGNAVVLGGSVAFVDCPKTQDGDDIAMRATTSISLTPIVVV